MLKSLDRFTADVVNLSAYDLPFVSRVLNKRELARRANEQPVLKRLVSANVVSESPDVAAPPPFLIKEVQVRRAGSPGTQPVRIAFVGLGGSTQEPLKAISQSLKLTDPIAAAKKFVPKARQQADIVVVIAHLSTDDALRVAREAQGIDMLIAGNGELFTPSQTIGQTLVVFTPHETRMLGELRFYRDAQGKYSIKDRYISLDGEIPDDAEARQIVLASESAYREVVQKTPEQRFELFRPSEESASAESAVGYATSSVCASCHIAEYMRWTNSRHGHALDSVMTHPAASDASCLQCHATGFGKGGFLSTAETPKLGNVQCEQCHGPGADHAAKPAKGYGRVSDARAVCSSCHTSATSPKFDFAAYWEKIKHGGH